MIRCRAQLRNRHAFVGRVRGVDRAWLRNLYGFAIAPHMVFYLNIDVKTLIGRVPAPRRASPAGQADGRAEY